MDRVWDEFVGRRANGRHAVWIYRRSAELADAVADYLAEGFGAGEPALVVATPEHRRRIVRALEGRGWNAARIDRTELLTVADAERTLAAFMVDHVPSAARFERVVGELVRRLEGPPPGRPLRVFGEMVELLAARGRRAEAARVEELWNELAARHDFSLLCAYRLDVFDRESQLTTLPDVCRTHSHVVPAADANGLLHAVDAALAEVLGREQAGRVYALAVRGGGATKVPLAQLVLMWVSRELPALSERVLASARRHYLAEPVGTRA